MLEIQKDTGMSLDAVQDQIRAVARRIEGYKIQHRELVRHPLRHLLHGVDEKLALCDAIRTARFEMLSLLAIAAGDAPSVDAIAEAARMFNI